MIVIDSSAALAVIMEEARANDVTNALLSDPIRVMSPANVLECVLRLAPKPAEDRSDRLDRFLATLSVSIPPIDENQLSLARAAFLAYGKGRHPAGLNFGDCFAYALAKSSGGPLLFIGEDFRKTDIAAAL